MYSISVVFNTDAAMAQSVARRLGKAEVGGSSPLGSLISKVFRKFYFLEAFFLYHIELSFKIKSKKR